MPAVHSCWFGLVPSPSMHAVVTYDNLFAQNTDCQCSSQLGRIVKVTVQAADRHITTIGSLHDLLQGAASVNAVCADLEQDTDLQG